MAVQPLVPPKFRAFDANGDPLSGGLLYSYEAGTTTPLATYTTRAGDVANANPVVLDANGEADVWVTGGTLYKFVLKDSAGVTQWTADNVPSSSDSLAFTLGDGTVSAPALTFTADIDTGLYRPAANQVAVAAGGTQSALFRADGVEVPGTLAVTGGIAGALPLNNNKITGLATPTASTDGATKGYVDTTLGTAAKATARVHVASAGTVTTRSSRGVDSVALVSGELQLTLTSALAAVDKGQVMATEYNSVAGQHLMSGRVVSTTVVAVNARDTIGTADNFGTGGGDLEVSITVYENP